MTDNIMAERLWHTVKHEEVYLKDYENVEDLITCLRQYFDYYNHHWFHQSLGDKTPAEVYREIGSLRKAT